MTFYCLVDTSLQGTQEGRSSCRISQKLYVPALRSAAPTCGSVNRGEIAGSWMFVSGRFSGCYERLVSTVETHVCSPAPSSDQRDTETDRTSPHITGYTSRGGVDVV